MSSIASSLRKRLQRSKSSAKKSASQKDIYIDYYADQQRPDDLQLDQLMSRVNLRNNTLPTASTPMTGNSVADISRMSRHSTRSGYAKSPPHEGGVVYKSTRPASLANSESTSGYRSTSVEEEEEMTPQPKVMQQRPPLRRTKSLYEERADTYSNASPRQAYHANCSSNTNVSTRRRRQQQQQGGLYQSEQPMTRTMSCCGGLKASNIYQQQQTKSQQPYIDNSVPLVYTEPLLYDNVNGVVYKKGRLLGKGGFAKCYELIDQRTAVIYAGKIIPKNRISKSHQRDKIIREIELHRTLCHENVVSFKSHFENDNNVIIVMELCNRKSLVHVLKQRRTLTEPEVRYYVLQLVNATRYIHSRHVIHRDLKLGNLLLNEDMQIKVGDFGLATKIEREGELKLTVCGTPNYISPEVLTKKGHSYQADLWAIGCIMYAMLVGKPPFETSTLKETYSRITTNTFHLPSALISAPARSLIRRLLSPNPVQRPSLRAILDDPFMTSGYCPRSLSTTCCERPPKFSLQRFLPNRPKSYIPSPTSCEALDALPSVDNGRSCEQLSKFSSINGRSCDQLNSISMNKSASRRAASTQHLCSTTTAKLRSQNAIPVTKNKRMSLAESKGRSPANKLFQTLVATLEAIQTTGSTVTTPCVNTNLTVIKWVDYSNRYGFGFQLSDHSVGVLFNDSTRMLLSPDARTIQYNDLSNKVFTFTIDSNESNEYRQKTTLLLYFSQYMDENLIIGANSNAANNNKNNNTNLVNNNNTINNAQTQSNNNSSWNPTSIFLKQWFRTDRAIVMFLNNGTLQVNFFADHTKVIISAKLDHSDYLVTYINRRRLATTYVLSELVTDGCDRDIIERLQYSKRVLDRIVNSHS